MLIGSTCAGRSYAASKCIGIRYLIIPCRGSKHKHVTKAKLWRTLPRWGCFRVAASIGEGAALRTLGHIRLVRHEGNERANERDGYAQSIRGQPPREEMRRDECSSQSSHSMPFSSTTRSAVFTSAVPANFAAHLGSCCYSFLLPVIFHPNI